MPDNRFGPGYIYLLRRHDGWYRIGRTVNPESRFRQWRWMAKNNRYHLKPLLLVEVENQGAMESLFHEIFAAKRTTIRQRGYGSTHEWFKLDRYDVKAFWCWATIVGKQLYNLNGHWFIPHKGRLDNAAMVQILQ